jgi:hypothetical protein
MYIYKILFPPQTSATRQDNASALLEGTKNKQVQT